MGYTTEYSLMKLDPKREKKNSDENQEEKQFIGPVQAPEIQNATKNSGGGSSGNGSGGSGGGAW